MILLPTDEEIEKINRKKDDAERLRMMRSEEEKKFYEALKEKKRKQRERMLKFEGGKWNPGLLEYLAEVHDRDIDQGYLDAPKVPKTRPIGKGSVVRLYSSEGKEKRAAAVDSEMGDPELEKQFGFSSVEDDSGARADMFPLKQAESLIDVPGAQSELEDIWVSLKLPLDQKLDMAIKYSNPKFSQKLELVRTDNKTDAYIQAITLWKTAAKEILHREKLLTEVARFEMLASDPDRFFRKGKEGSSFARMEESKAREELLRQLHRLEAKITSVVMRIRRYCLSLLSYLLRLSELHETVTYVGAPYLVKMKVDVSTQCGNLILTFSVCGNHKQSAKGTRSQSKAKVCQD